MILGFTEFLVGENAPVPSSLPDAIAKLEDASIIFVQRWKKRDMVRAGDVSRRAMELLDFIANELLREKVERKGASLYSGSVFEAAMSVRSAAGVTNVSEQDHLDVVLAGPGLGALPPGRPQLQINLDRLLNKIKHRKRSLANFRIDNDRHIFVICTDKTHGGAEGIYEFEVEDFCKYSDAAAGAL